MKGGPIFFPLSLKSILTPLFVMYSQRTHKATFCINVQFILMCTSLKNLVELSAMSINLYF